MVTNNALIDYMHWDDPNELVDRLRLLMAERQAGNPSHDNEIQSIFQTNTVFLSTMTRLSIENKIKISQ